MVRILICLLYTSSYTATDHRKRFEQCAYTKEEYTARRDSARVVQEAFATGYTQKLNALTNEKGIEAVSYTHLDVYKRQSATNAS